MSFFQALWTEARHANTPWVLLGIAVSFVLSRAVAIDRPRFKAVLGFTTIHLLAIIVTAALVASGSTVDATFRTFGWVFGSVALVGAMSSLLFSVALPRIRVRTPLIVQDVIVAIASVIVSVAVLGRANVNLSGLIATSAVFTAILGFSLQDVIGNVAGGLALQVDNSIEEGDWIKVGDVTGRVVEIRWRHTAVETRNWETVLIPNAVLMKSQVAVLGRRAGQPKLWRRWVYFNVDWRHQPGDVINCVQTAVRAAQIERVAKDPPASCVLMDMADTYGKYAVRYWLTDIAVDDPTDSEVRSCVYFALQRSDMRLANPTQSVYLVQQTVEKEQIKTERQLKRRRDLLGSIELFGTLSPEEREELAKNLKYAPFAKGDVMTRQGAEAHWLYLVEDGEASVRVSDGQLEREVATMKGPNVFGEMSLLTGDPRSATVIATSEVECFRLDKSAVQKVLEARPELAAQLANLLAKRMAGLQAAKEGLDADAAKKREEREANALLARIRSFFALR